RVIARVAADASNDFLGALAAEIAKHERAIALLAHAGTGQLFFVSNASSGKDMAALLKQVLDQMGGKGGGTREAARGRLTEPAKAQQAIEAASQLLAAS